MTAAFVAPGDFTPPDDSLTSLWLFACQQEMAAESGMWGAEAWRAAADAWATLARAAPEGNLQDLQVWWGLAGAAARKARRAR
jgi:hypothetical protein